MENYIFVTTCILLFIAKTCLSAECGLASSPHKPIVGYVEQANVVDGCGCLFQFTDEERLSGKYIFSSSLENSGWINLNGKDIQLKLISSNQAKVSSKKGSRFKEIYTGGKVTVEIDYIVTWTCAADAPEDESCETTKYDVDITFSQDGQRNLIKAKGECGC